MVSVDSASGFAPAAFDQNVFRIVLIVNYCISLGQGQEFDAVGEIGHIGGLGNQIQISHTSADCKLLIW